MSIVTLAVPKSSFTVTARFSLHSKPNKIAHWTEFDELARIETAAVHVGKPILYSGTNLKHL